MRMYQNLLNLLSSRKYYVLIGIYLAYILIIVLFSANWFDQVRSFTNISDSMSPAINTGSVTVVQKFPSYSVGDAIAYYSQNEGGGEEIVTHRVTGIGGNVYTTKGDANQVEDREIVRPRLIIGKVVWIVPYLGYLIRFAKSVLGTWLTIILPAVLLIAAELAKVIRVVVAKREAKISE